MELLKSISAISMKYQTKGSRPVQLMASDLETYVVKYPFYNGDFRLINEFLGDQLNYTSFKAPTLGFKQLENVLDLNDFATSLDASAIT